jgi:hypothetical protein
MESCLHDTVRAPIRCGSPLYFRESRISFHICKIIATILYLPCGINVHCITNTIIIAEEKKSRYVERKVLRTQHLYIIIYAR